MLKKSLSAAILLLLACGACAPAPTTLSTPLPASATAASSALPSATPEPSPTPTALPPTPLPRVFTEEFEGALPGWSLLQSNADSAPQVRLADGALVFELDTPFQWAYAILGTQDYAAARLDASVQSRGTSPEAIGLICRYSEKDGWYEFNVSSDGEYSVLFGQWLSEGIATYVPIASDNSQYLKTGGAANEVGLLCNENTLSLYLNGKLFRNLNVERFGLVSGKLGLAVASFENVPVRAAFEWVKVSEP